MKYTWMLHKGCQCNLAHEGPTRIPAASCANPAQSDASHGPKNVLDPLKRPIGNPLILANRWSNYITEWNALFIFFSLILALMLHECTGYATPYQVEGTLTYQVGSPDSPKFPRWFRVTCDGPRWEIRVWVPEKRETQQFVYQYDGTNSISYLELPQNPKNGEDATGLIENVPVPQTWNSSTGEYVWLAYASGDYFKSRTNDSAMSLMPIRSSKGFVAREEVRCSWDSRKSPPYLPSSVSYFCDAYVMFTPDGNLVTNMLPKPFENGFRRLEFSSSGSQTLSDFDLPTTFEVRKFASAKNPTRSNDLICVATIRGVMTNLTTPSGFILSAPNKLTAHDERPPEQFVLYSVTNRVVPNTDDPLVEKERKKAIKFREEARRFDAKVRTGYMGAAKTRNRIATIAFLVLVIALPLIIWPLLRKRG